MPRSSGDGPLRLTAGSCIFAALLLLVLPIQWVFAAVLAAGLHELCHICAIRLCGSEIRHITLSGRGAVIEAEPMSYGKEFFCALAGPAGGLLLLLLARWLPRVAVCAGVQSLYNLLPVYPLDGGRALRCGAVLLFPQWGDRLCFRIEQICIFGIVLLALYACLWLKLGLLPVLFAVMLLLKRKNTLQTP